MEVPQPVPFSTLNNGDVFQVQGSANYAMKADTTNAVDLASGTIAANFNPTTGCIVYPAARLVLG